MSLDRDPCIQDKDKAACAGFGLGIAGTLGSGVGATADWAIAFKLLEKSSLPSAVLHGVGALGFQLGLGATAADLGGAMSHVGGC